MEMVQTVRTVSFTEAFGYRIFFPETKDPRTSRLLGEMIGAEIAGCRNLTEVTSKICRLGCVLVYKPRVRCFIMCPGRNSLLESRIREFESAETAE